MATQPEPNTDPTTKPVDDPIPTPTDPPIPSPIDPGVPVDPSEPPSPGTDPLHEGP
jgi:hypothetical protein